uniref:Uncharacterized protein n=1 Tax=Anguilla anguilla TaxID=7936 RepID=A0A0E9U094_ANGAN
MAKNKTLLISNVCWGVHRKLLTKEHRFIHVAQDISVMQSTYTVEPLIQALRDWWLSGL